MGTSDSKVDAHELTDIALFTSGDSSLVCGDPIMNIDDYSYVHASSYSARLPLDRKKPSPDKGYPLNEDKGYSLNEELQQAQKAKNRKLSKDEDLENCNYLVNGVEALCLLQSKEQDHSFIRNLQNGKKNRQIISSTPNHEASSSYGQVSFCHTESKKADSPPYYRNIEIDGLHNTLVGSFSSDSENVTHDIESRWSPPDNKNIASFKESTMNGDAIYEDSTFQRKDSKRHIRWQKKYTLGKQKEKCGRRSPFEGGECTDGSNLGRARSKSSESSLQRNHIRRRSFTNLRILRRHQRNSSDEETMSIDSLRESKFKEKMRYLQVAARIMQQDVRATLLIQTNPIHTFKQLGLTCDLLHTCLTAFFYPYQDLHVECVESIAAELRDPLHKDHIRIKFNRHSFLRSTCCLVVNPTASVLVQTSDCSLLRDVADFLKHDSENVMVVETRENKLFPCRDRIRSPNNDLKYEETDDQINIFDMDMFGSTAV